MKPNKVVPELSIDDLSVDALFEHATQSNRDESEIRSLLEESVDDDMCGECCEESIQDVLQEVTDAQLIRLARFYFEQHGRELVMGASENHAHLAGALLINGNLEDIAFSGDMLIEVQIQARTRRNAMAAEIEAAA